MSREITEEMIDRFLTGEMKDEELASFLSSLEENPEVKKRIQQDKEAYAALRIVRNAHRRESLKKADQKLRLFKMVKMICIGLAVLLALFVVCKVIGC